MVESIDMYDFSRSVNNIAFGEEVNEERNTFKKEIHEKVNIEEKATEQIGYR